MAWNPIVAQLIRRKSRRYGIDPAAALAVASVEGGVRYGAVGDQGTSFGPFQLHVGGALPRGKGAGWANSPAGIDYAIRKMAEAGARGLRGRNAVATIVRRFERPAAPGAEIERAMGNYPKYRGGDQRGRIAAGGGGRRAGRGPGSSLAQPQRGLDPATLAQLKGLSQIIGVPFTLGGLAAPPRQQRNVAPGTQRLKQRYGAQQTLKVQGKVTPRARNVVRLAHEYLGTPYVWGGERPGGFDCSGFIQWLYGQQGVKLPRVTYDQWRVGEAIGKHKLQPGDAVFFRPGPKGPEHMGLYIGGGKFMHAPKTGDVIKISKLNDSYYQRNYMGARRYGN